MFKNPFSFEGRIRRTEYGLSMIIYYIALLLIAMLSAGSDMQVIAFLFYIPFIWFMLAQGAKRCHDKGNSGWWQLIPFYILVLLFSDGQPNYNNYGADPKARGAFEDQY